MNTAVNVEQIVVWNPQVIFIGAFDDATPDDLMRLPALAGVDAVRERRVYKLPHGGYRWDPGSHESHLTWQWAAMLLHPERARFDLRGAMRGRSSATTLIMSGLEFGGQELSKRPDMIGQSSGHAGGLVAPLGLDQS
jgi:hypothetical protein